MSKAKKSELTKTFLRKPKKDRKGIHAKTKTSRSKNSRSYKKAYRGQGR
jgi:hypothetical protein